MKVDQTKVVSFFLFAVLCFVIHVEAASSQIRYDSEMGSEDLHRSQTIKKILSSMSLEEKIGQMLQVDITFYLKHSPGTELNEKFEEDMKKYHIGSFFNNQLSINEWLQFITKIQQISLSSSTQKIPMVYALDSVHGANYVFGATLFPQFICAAASFNPMLVEDQASITAKDTRTIGVPWTFSPTLGIAATPLWSRNYEIFGEDPYLNSQFAIAMVRGLSGRNPSLDMRNNTKVASCMKHFIGYCYPSDGRDHENSEISDRFMRDYLTPSFRSAINASVPSAMISMGSINGVPVTGSTKYVRDLLVKEMGFQGLIVTDYVAIQQLYNRFFIAMDEKHAIKLALDAGMDIAMWATDTSFHDLLTEMVKNGQVPESRIDQSVSKILDFKMKLGLFENPFPDIKNPNIKTIGSDHDREVARNIIRESITLLKNEGSLLPLKKLKKDILVVGPAANSLRMLNGGWTVYWQGATNDTQFSFGETIYKGIQRLANVTVHYIEGTGVDHPDDDSLQKAISLIHSGSIEIVIAACGESPYAEVLGNINDLSLSEPQHLMLRALHKTGIPMVLVLVQGRPRVITWESTHIPAIINAYLPGSEGGTAIAEILFGITNPSGRLPISYPQTVNFFRPYWHRVTVDYMTPEHVPLWKFGHGLSYSKFTYSNLVLSKRNVHMKEVLNISVTIHNEGPFDGKETVLLFIRDLVATGVTPSDRRLRKFTKLTVKAGEKREVVLDILPYQDLQFVGLDDTKFIVEPGEFTCYIGNLQETFLVYE